MPPDSFGARLTAEIRNLIGTRGQPLRQTLAAFVIPLLVLIAFGILVPLSKGLDFFDPLILGAYAALGGIFAGPAAATAVDRPTLSLALARVLATSIYGELVALVLLGTGIATVYWTHRQRVFFPPDLGSLTAVIGFGAALTLALTTFAL